MGWFEPEFQKYTRGGRMNFKKRALSIRFIAVMTLIIAAGSMPNFSWGMWTATGRRLATQTALKRTSAMTKPAAQAQMRQTRRLSGLRMTPQPQATPPVRRPTLGERITER
jgi:hypothetical protein